MSKRTDTDFIFSKTTELLEQLQLQAEVSVTFDKQTGYYHIQLETEAPGLLIGYRGETLSSFQLILGLLINKSQDIRNPASDPAVPAPTDLQEQRKKIIVNIGDYRQRREETLTQLAQNAAQRVKFSGEPYVFEKLTPAERRVVHLTLQEDSEITTYSEGEGRHRQLVVAPK